MKQVNQISARWDQKLKRVSLAVCLLGLAMYLTGCASTRGYFVDRGRDAADIFTTTAGVGGGGQVRLGPLPLGFLQATDVTGLRYGDTFYRIPRSGHDAEERCYTVGAICGVLLFPVLCCGGGDGGGKVFSKYLDGIGAALDYRDSFPMNETQLRRHKDTEGVGASGSYQIEAAVGLGLVFRVGINVGELVDFILGWTTIDIFGDDIEVREL